MNHSYQPTLRERLVARYNPAPADYEPLDVPATGLIPATTVAAIEILARLAQDGDIPARDRLFTALQPRLVRKGFILRPWPNTPRQTGIWDRDDIQQEGWIIFAELLAAWDGEVNFLPYLLARFAWRLRDRILRGIGKPMPPIGVVRVPEIHLVDLLSAHDSDQPESALLARKLLEKLMQGSMRGEIELLDPHAVLTVLQSPESRQVRRTGTWLDEDHPVSQIDAA